jgi:hypothetical protein
VSRDLREVAPDKAFSARFLSVVSLLRWRHPRESHQKISTYQPQFELTMAEHSKGEKKDSGEDERDGGRTSSLDRTVAAFQFDPSLQNIHPVAAQLYATFCNARTAALYTTFFALVGDEDYLNWLGEATYSSAFRACAPFHGKKDERSVAGGKCVLSGKMHGLVRYEYKKNVIEECRREGEAHGLRVVCLETGHVYIRLYNQGKRVAQIVLNSDMSVQSMIDDGGLMHLQKNLHLITSCFKQ